ncbi:MAG: triose-phosphate isomerase [Candidatus Wolfebacteria bacterium]|nr:triose-phosphate isomerase [Candidatus Wolfebacteria bacterium]
MAKLLIFNWKMNPGTFKEAEKILGESIILEESSDKYEIAVCPPSLWLFDLSQKYAGKITFGSQDVFGGDPLSGKGASTGEISAEMLKNSKVEYIIVGHSERRRYENETDEMISKKTEVGLKAGFKVILCVGEDLNTHSQGPEAVKSFIKDQLEKDLENIHNSKFIIHNSLIVAYEPIWAIGTGIPENPESAALMAKYIKEAVGAQVLYGGSVDGKNIGNFIKYEEIDGFLIGGASLSPAQFGGQLN